MRRSFDTIYTEALEAMDLHLVTLESITPDVMKKFRAMSFTYDVDGLTSKNVHRFMERIAEDENKIFAFEDEKGYTTSSMKRKLYVLRMLRASVYDFRTCQ